MSFILDALKKAESERNRRVAPVLMDARIAPPRRRLPVWAWVLGAVLLVNLLVLGVLLWRSPEPAAASSAPAVPADSPAPSAAPAVATANAPVVAPVVAPAPATPPTTTPTPGTAPAPATPAVMPATSLYAPPQAPLDTGNLPSAQELRLAGVPLPELQLNLHVYDPAPTHRSVLLNGQRLREGEYTPDGVKLERVTPTGTVLEAGGRRFRLDVGD